MYIYIYIYNCVDGVLKHLVHTRNHGDMECLEQLLCRCLNFPYIGHERTLKYKLIVNSK